MSGDEGRIKILCIDDEELFLGLLSDCLTSWGYEALTASDVSRGLDIFYERGPGAVLLDLMMPGTGGLDVLAEISEASPETPLIVISATGNISHVIGALRMGAWDYLRKPMEDLDILGLSLEKALQKAALLRENRLYREKLEGLVEKRTHDLRESESRFRRLADNARDLIWRIKIPEGNIEYASPASRRILGFTPEELYEDHTLLLNSLREEDRPSFREFWESVKRGDPPETLEICMVAASGEPRWIYQSNVLVTDESGVPLALEAICTDITERKRIESEREALIADLKAKNGELELFTYTVSHDLRSPLVTIRGFADGLKEDLASGDMGRVGEDVQRIISAAEKMNLLLRDLLELSRVGRIMNSSSEIFLPELIGEVRELLHAEISGSGAVIELREPLPVVRGDFPRIREVFQNLIENAIKFTSRGETPRILIGSERRNGEEVIYVRDKGIGIDPSQRERIFGLFQKIDRNQPGTGLGLALARRIIEVHGGRIWVESPGEGGGATFCLTIPVKAGPARVFFRDGFS